jgi:hypothetical protein
MKITFCNVAVHCPKTPVAFDRMNFGKLLAIKARLAEPEGLTPDQIRELASAMHEVLRSAVPLENPTRDWGRINPNNDIVIAARQAHDLFASKTG